MKIQKVAFRKHFFFGDVDIDLTGTDSKPLDTVVFAGNNGCGKTTLLETIFALLTGSGTICKDSGVVLNFEELVKNGLLKENSLSSFSENLLRHNRKEPLADFRDHFNATLQHSGVYLSKMLTEISDDQRPKVVYLPAEIAFEKMTVKETAFDYKYRFSNNITKNHVHQIPTYISTIIKDTVFKNEDLPAKTSIKKVCAEINQIFEDLEIDARLVGLSEEGAKLPVFTNSAGASFDINGLSSGEKQLFARALTLRMVRANNSIILIDEPEISLHPKWQQKILRVYESIGKNNQVIIATHSPHILSSCGKESSFLLSKEKGKAKVENFKNLVSAYGKPVSVVLMDFMGLKTLRDPEIEVQFEALREMVRNNKSDSAIFKEKMADLVEIVGEIDEDIILLKMELARIEAKRQKKNA